MEIAFGNVINWGFFEVIYAWNCLISNKEVTRKSCFFFSTYYLYHYSNETSDNLKIKTEYDILYSVINFQLISFIFLSNCWYKDSLICRHDFFKMSIHSKICCRVRILSLYPTNNKPIVPIKGIPICLATCRPLTSSISKRDAFNESDKIIASLSPASKPLERRSNSTADVSFIATVWIFAFPN